ncbi:MAG TPA: CopD family protein [Azospirillum sp.]|nr:CopD family protein [Azospirillum sp.]
MNSLCRWAGAILLAALPVGSWSGSARAHAVLLESTPADGQVLPAAPDRATLRFNEPVQVTVLRLIEPSGRAVPLTPETGGPPDRAAAPLPALGRGSHVLSWRLASADGHPLGGSLVFSVGAADAGTTGAARATDGVPPGLGIAYSIVRMLTYGASLMATGGAIFLVLFAGQVVVDTAALRRSTAAAVTLATLSTVAGGVLQSMILTGGFLEVPGLGSALAPGVLGSGLLRLGGLAAITLGLLRPSVLLPLGAAGAVMVAGSFALTGHTAPHGADWLRALLVFHLLAAAFWIGAFGPLAAATRHPDRGGVARLMTRFSVIATGLVPALVAAGLVMGWHLVGGWAALATTAYGLVLLAKVAAVAAMLGLAALNKMRIAPALERDERAPARLRRSIVGEGAIAAGVFALTTALTSVPPPSAGQGTGAGGAAYEVAPGRKLRMWAGAYELALQVTPGLPGTNAVELRVSSEANGTPEDVVAAMLRIDNPALGIEEISRTMKRVDTGRYVLRGPEFGAPGRWRVKIELLVSDFEKRTAGTSVDIGPVHPEGH